MKILLQDLPNPQDADHAYDTLKADAARAIGAGAREVTVSVALLGMLAQGYLEQRLSAACAEANDFEGGDQWRGYEKTRRVAEAYGFADYLPDYTGPRDLRDAG